ncbi:hypothetical protein V7S43_006793 [Phytophthora oleae]|uniref:PiggyBac transposable element-derived protein domain-containing protein n=1 Tax=Phytophthora oleae TaxID=2107226 RepID=A0ABD3FQI4_9STRA
MEDGARVAEKVVVNETFMKDKVLVNVERKRKNGGDNARPEERVLGTDDVNGTDGIVYAETEQESFAAVKHKEVGEERTEADEDETRLDLHAIGTEEKAQVVTVDEMAVMKSSMELERLETSSSGSSSQGTRASQLMERYAALPSMLTEDDLADGTILSDKNELVRVYFSITGVVSNCWTLLDSVPVRAKWGEMPSTRDKRLWDRRYGLHRFDNAIDVVSRCTLISNYRYSSSSYTQRRVYSKIEFSCTQFSN